MSIESRCDWAANHQGIRFDGTFLIDGKPTPYTSGSYNWDAAKRQIVFSYSDAEGSLTDGAVELQSGALVHNFNITKSDGKVEIACAVITPRGADTYTIKSRFGLNIQETPRAQAFCTHAIMQPEMFEVPDATKDKRFAENSLVAGDPHIRFYAGAPLGTRDGHLLGTLCVMDREPHTLTPAQKEALQILGRMVIANIELSRDLQQLRDALAARDAAAGPTGESAGGLDDIIARLQNIASDLQAVREEKPGVVKQTYSKAGSGAR